MILDCGFNASQLVNFGLWFQCISIDNMGLKLKAQYTDHTKYYSTFTMIVIDPFEVLGSIYTHIIISGVHIKHFSLDWQQQDILQLVVWSLDVRELYCLMTLLLVS